MKPFIVMDIVKAAQKYPNAIHLEIGEPDILPSPKVIESANKAILNNKFFYTESKGLYELREKISLHYKKFYQVDINPERIIITTGTSTAFLMAYYFAKKIAIADPSYPCYDNFGELQNKEIIKIDVDKTTNYQITPKHLKDKDFDTLLISAVNNPTGTIYDNENLKELAHFCEKNGKLLISDELYHGLVYDKEYSTALKFNDKAIVINGFSKFFCMPGFRIGWIIVPDELIRQTEIIAQNILISAPTLSQYAALEAFDYEYLKQTKNIFKQRRDFLFNELKDIFDIDSVDGAFYLWCNISRYKIDSLEFCKRLLETKQVAITPGIDFGSNKTNKFVRIAYTKNINELKQAVQRIKEFVKSL